MNSSRMKKRKLRKNLLNKLNPLSQNALLKESLDAAKIYLEEEAMNAVVETTPLLAKVELEEANVLTKVKTKETLSKSRVIEATKEVDVVDSVELEVEEEVVVASMPIQTTSLLKEILPKEKCHLTNKREKQSPRPQTTTTKAETLPPPPSLPSPLLHLLSQKGKANQMLQMSDKTVLSKLLRLFTRNQGLLPYLL